MQNKIAVRQDMKHRVLRAAWNRIKRKAADTALLRRQASVRTFRGKLGWEGDLAHMRA